MSERDMNRAGPRRPPRAGLAVVVIAVIAGAFVGGAVLAWKVLLPAARQDDLGGALLLTALAMLLFAVVAGVAGWSLVRATPPRSTASEQRLWRSGPLGRAWLRIRNRLPGG